MPLTASVRVGARAVPCKHFQQTEGASLRSCLAHDGQQVLRLCLRLGLTLLSTSLYHTTLPPRIRRRPRSTRVQFDRAPGHLEAMTDFDSAPERYRQDVSMQYGDRIQFYTQAAWLREHSKNNPIPSNYTTVSVALHNVAQLVSFSPHI